MKKMTPDEIEVLRNKRIRQSIKDNPITDYTQFTYYHMPVAARRKIDVGDIFMNQGQCRQCGWVIRSRNRHHVDTCACGAVSVDGGSWYQKVGGSDLSLFESHILYYAEQEDHEIDWSKAEKTRFPNLKATAKRLLKNS